MTEIACVKALYICTQKSVEISVHSIMHRHVKLVHWNQTKTIPSVLSSVSEKHGQFGWSQVTDWAIKEYSRSLPYEALGLP